MKAKGVKYSPEAIAGSAANRRGATRSVETRERMKSAWSAERRAAQSQRAIEMMRRRRENAS